MTLGSVVGFVDEMGAAIDRHRRAFSVKALFRDEAPPFADLDAGGVALVSPCTPGAGRSMPSAYRRPVDGSRQGGELARFTTDVRAAYERAVAAGRCDAVPPAVMPWTRTVACARKVEGTLIGLCSLRVN